MTSIKILNDEGNKIDEELVILEFQGDFEHSNSTTFDNLPLGSMKELTGGNYEL